MILDESWRLPVTGPRRTAGELHRHEHAPTLRGTLQAPYTRGRSIREFSDCQIPLKDLVEAVEPLYREVPRAVPSAGSVYGLSFSVLTSATDLPLNSATPVIRRRRGDLSRLVFHRLQGSFHLLVIAVETPRYVHRYGPRGRRYALIEAGHFMQVFLAEAHRRSWAVCPVGGFHDDGVAELISRPPWYPEPVYLAGVGRQ
ncbi:nitroreductase family protein [Streptomyces sp. NPDC088775]|uniref:nitroreductase family protein n=1 Tax=Streptomyces sp. NPDC088775 TaxID=3365896 RepID=UPI0038259BC3